MAVTGERQTVVVSTPTYQRGCFFLLYKSSAQ